MSFGENLKKELYYNDIKVKEMAKRINIPYSTMLSYMNNKNCLPNVETGAKIARVLNVSVEYLVFGTSGIRNKSISQQCNDIVLRLSRLPSPVLSLFEQLIILVTENISSKQDVPKTGTQGA